MKEVLGVTLLPATVAEFRDQQRRLMERFPETNDPETAYRRFVLYLLAEIACELKALRAASAPEGK